jgi:hypothetical protein
MTSPALDQHDGSERERAEDLRTIAQSERRVYKGKIHRVDPKFAS